MAGDPTQFGRIFASFTVPETGPNGFTPNIDGDRRAGDGRGARRDPVVDGSADHA